MLLGSQPRKIQSNKEAIQRSLPPKETIQFPDNRNNVSYDNNRDPAIKSRQVVSAPSQRFPLKSFNSDNTNKNLSTDGDELYESPVIFDGNGAGIMKTFDEDDSNNKIAGKDVEWILDAYILMSKQFFDPIALGSDRKCASPQQDFRSHTPNAPLSPASPSELPRDSSPGMEDKAPLYMSATIAELLPERNSPIDETFAQSKKGETVKGWTKGYSFDAEQANSSPYLTHLGSNNPLAGMTLAQIAQSVFAKSKDKKKSKRSKKSEVQGGGGAKSFAIITDEQSMFYKKKQSFVPTSLMQDRPTTPSNLNTRPISRAPSPMRYSPDKESEEYFVATAKAMRSGSARQVLNEGKLVRRQSPDATTRVNLMSTLPTRVPSAPKFRSLSDMNDIDRLVTGQSKLVANKSAAPNRPNDIFLRTLNSTSGNNNGGMQGDTNGRLGSVDMLANIHIDPLYRIIREEMERIEASKDSHDSARANKAKDYIKPAHVRFISYFYALPPSVWVTCRIVYFVLISYYEVVIRKPEYKVYREFTQLEQLWKILEDQYENQAMSIATATKLFSWSNLQELLKNPSLFCKGLTLIEHGLQLTHQQWAQFHQKLENERLIMISKKIEFNVDEYKVLASIRDEESSRGLFFDMFPMAAFQPLREMVKAARGFLLPSHSSLQNTGSSQPLVPGTPLAVSVPLTSWLKRVIALLYISGTNRAKLSKALSLNPSSEGRPGSAAANTVDAGSAVMDIKLQPPPNMSFVCIINEFTGADYKNELNLESNCPPFFVKATGLIRPSDSFEALIYSPSVEYDSNSIQESISSIKNDIEMHFRVTSASPIHRVAILGNYTSISSINEALKDSPQTAIARRRQVGGEDLILKSMHPGVAYAHYKQAAPKSANRHQANALQSSSSVDVLMTKLSSLQEPMPLVDGLALTSSEATYKIRDEIKFSLAVINDQENSSPSVSMQSTSKRYIVAVNESSESWNAFQLACRLALESDTLIIVHIPTLRLSDLCEKPEQLEKISSLTLKQFQKMYERAVHRKEQVVSLYKGLGYNVFSTAIPTFIDTAKRVLENYSSSVNLKLDALEVLGSEFQCNPMTSYEYFVANEERRLHSRQLLNVAVTLEADFIVVGATSRNIFSTLSCEYTNSALGFKLDSFHGSDEGEPLRNGVVRENRAGVITFQDAATISDEDENAEYPLLEEKAVVLGEVEVYGDEDFEEDSFPQRLQLGQEQEQQANNIRVQPNLELVNVRTTGGSSEDYDLDSFIIEDNDEGDNSLTASPVNGHGSARSQPSLGKSLDEMNIGNASSSPERIAEIRERRAVSLIQFREYARKPVQFVDLLLHEAADIDQWMIDSGNKPSHFSGVVADLFAATSPSAELTSAKASSKNKLSFILANFSYVSLNGLEMQNPLTHRPPSSPAPVLQQAYPQQTNKQSKGPLLARPATTETSLG